MSTTPLPELERQLRAAARRLDAAAPRRSRLRHGGAIAAIVLATGSAGVAAAKVVGFDPFGYQDRLAETYPKLAPMESLTLTDGGTTPRWRARASLTKSGSLCLTAGRAEAPPRPEPTSGSTPGKRAAEREPLSNGTTCADSDEIAEALIEPTRSGATFASQAPLAGTATRPTRLLVYAVTDESGPTPRVRFGPTGTPVAMRSTTTRMVFPVDRSPDGLTPAAYAQVLRYPANLRLRLWAAELPMPKGTRLPQLLAPELARDQADDSLLEVVDEAAFMERAEAVERAGTSQPPHIERAEKPVPGMTAGQRRWIGAFARPRLPADAVPASRIGREQLRMRVQPAASRRVTVAGADLGPVWLLPGGMAEFLRDDEADDALCVIGPAVLGQCKIGTRRWKRPLVEAVVCSRLLDPRRTLVWALAPPGATGVEIVEADGRTEPHAFGELVAIRRPQGDRIRAISWLMGSAPPKRVSVPWPKQKARPCGAGLDHWQVLRRDSAGSSATGTVPRPGERLPRGTTVVVAPPELAG